VEPFTTSSTGKLFTLHDAHLALTLEGILLYDTICGILFQRSS